MEQLASAPQTVLSNMAVQSPDTLLDRMKFGATLFFTGIFIDLVGVVFTVTGWEHYRANGTFEWSQILGPVIIITGGTLIVTSVWKFRILSCWSCKQQDEEAAVIEETSTGHTFTLSCINQQVLFSGATTMLCVPPVYDFRNQEVRLASIPSYESVCCMDNAAFTAEEESSAGNTGTGHRMSRSEEERHGDGDSGSTRSRPPAYEDIYPSFQKHNRT